MHDSYFVTSPTTYTSLCRPYVEITISSITPIFARSPRKVVYAAQHKKQKWHWQALNLKPIYIKTNTHTNLKFKESLLPFRFSPTLICHLRFKRSVTENPLAQKFPRNHTKLLGCIFTTKIVSITAHAGKLGSYHWRPITQIPTRPEDLFPQLHTHTFCPTRLTLPPLLSAEMRQSQAVLTDPQHQGATQQRNHAGRFRICVYS